MSFLLEGITAVTWQQAVMYVVGIILIWLAVKKEYEPSLLLPLPSCKSQVFPSFCLVQSLFQDGEHHEHWTGSQETNCIDPSPGLLPC